MSRKHSNCQSCQNWTKFLKKVVAIIFQSVIKNSVDRMSEEGSDRSISSEVFGGGILD